MNLTKRQKMLSAVFLIGVVGLVADRTILRPQGGPQAAAADSGSPAGNHASGSSSLSVSPSTAPALDRGPAARAPVAERLNQWLGGKETDPNDQRDPFCLPATWSGTGSGDGPRTPDSIRSFLQKHQLKAVVLQEGEWHAQVDDGSLMPGQYLDGFKLISVDHRSAVFERDGKQVVLELIVR